MMAVPSLLRVISNFCPLFECEPVNVFPVTRSSIQASAFRGMR